MMSNEVITWKTMDKRDLLKWAILFAIGLFLFFIPENAVYTFEVKKFAIITVTAILMIAFELLPLIIPALYLMFGYYLSGLAPTSVAFSGWTSTSTYLVLGCLIMVGALEETGILTRLAYWCMIKCGGTYKGIVWGIFIACVLTSVITMGNSYALMGAFALGCVAAMKIENTKMSAVIGAAVCIGTCSIRSLVYSPMLTAVQTAQSQTVLGTDYHLSITGVPMHNWPILIGMVLSMFLIFKLYKPERQLTGKAHFVEKYKALGAISMLEKKSAIYLVLIIGWMVFDAWIPLSSDYAIILLPWLMLFPVIGVAAPGRVLKKVDWNVIFFIPGCFGIGNVASTLGLGETIANLILPYVQNAGGWVFVDIVYVMTFVLNFFLTPYAIHSCMTVPLINVALQMGIDPICVNYMLMHGADAVLLPYEYTMYLLVFAFGLMKMTDFIKLMSINLLVKGSIILLVIPFWWQIIGLL